MTTQTEAQQIADELKNTPFQSTRYEAAAELLRLDKIEAEWAALSQDEGKAQREIERLEAANAELIEALIVAYGHIEPQKLVISHYRDNSLIRAAIAKHGGQS